MYGQPTTIKYLQKWKASKTIYKYGLFRIKVTFREGIKNDIHSFLDGKIGGIIDVNTGKGDRIGWIFYKYPDENFQSPNYMKPEYHRVKLEMEERFWKKDFSQLIIFCKTIIITMTRIQDPTWVLMREFKEQNEEERLNDLEELNNLEEDLNEFTQEELEAKIYEPVG